MRVRYFRTQGLAPADRVFVHFGNRIEFFVDLLAIWRAGGCVIPIDPRFTPFEIEALANGAKPRFSLWLDAPDTDVASRLATLGVSCLARGETEHHPDQLIENVAGGTVDLDADALVLFTSGTTGQPKGVVHTHRSLRAQWMNLRAALGLESFQHTLCLLPTHFGHGLICNCLFPWLSGHDLFVLPPFQTTIIGELGRLIDDYNITFMSSVPSLWRLALRTGKPPEKRSLKRVFCGSAPLSASLWTEIERWAGARVANAYGITETASWLAGTTIPEAVVEDGLIGVPWGTVVKVLKRKDMQPPPEGADECAPGESGYVWVNTAALMRGYLDRDDLTRSVVSDGWFLTGDIGLLDDRGWLSLRGREREEINKGGMKVYPGDVDVVVERLPEVADVCTFGYEDLLYGENIGIAVVLKSTSEATLRKLHQWTADHLARHQLPMRWYVVKEIPRTSRGKVNRSDVARRCESLSPISLLRAPESAPPKADDTI